MPLTFFTHKQEEQQSLLIDYSPGTRTKRLFYAIAYGLIHLIKTNQFENKSLLGSLLSQHANYFPRQLPQHIQNLPASEQIEYLLIYTQPHAEMLVPSLAYTLQQMAVDVICSKPEMYGNLLLQGKTIAELRKQPDLDDPSVLQAIVDEILMINIYLERYPDSYQLPVKEYYLTPNNNPTNLYIHYQDRFYMTQSELEGDD